MVHCCSGSHCIRFFFFKRCIEEFEAPSPQLYCTKKRGDGHEVEPQKTASIIKTLSPNEKKKKKEYKKKVAKSETRCMWR